MAAFFCSCLPTMRFPLTLFQFLSILSLFCSNSASAQCLDNQKSSLLTLFGSSPISSWTPNTDCCIWKGVTCDGSGHVTGLDLTNHGIRAPINSTSLTTLSSLRNLNLSSNLFNSYIPVSISGLSKLTHLNLSNSGFEGHVPVEISHIKGLESLDLSFSSSFPSLRFRSHDFGHVIGNLSGLRELILDGVDISSPAPESLGMLANLTSLHLSLCNLKGEFPVKIFRLQNLETIDLSGNSLLSGTLPEFPSDSKLQILSLSSTSFTGELPNSFGNLRYLRRLEVNACNFSGRIPSSLGRISQLSHFDISLNNFSGQVPSLENLTLLAILDLSTNRFSGRIPSLSSLKNAVRINLSNNNLSGTIDSSFGEGHLSLESLRLHNNSLVGKIPSSLFTLPSLLYLDLSQNQFDVPLDEFGNASSSLFRLNLSNNKLQGPIPSSVFQLKGLAFLLLSSNNFSGTVNLLMLQNLKNLSYLSLSNNRLSVNASGTATSFPQLDSLELSSCNLVEFPKFLKNQSRLSYLDLSNNKINGEIPNWIWRVGSGSLIGLNLSHNMLYSHELPTVDLSLSSLIWLDLHSNKLQGSIPIPPPTVSILDYSYNNFTSVIPENISLYFRDTFFLFSLAGNNIGGKIPSSLCNAIKLTALDLSMNNLSGSIPHCLVEMDNLRVLNLEKNDFSGIIPHRFGHGCSLQTLNLNKNRLEGSLPRSLTYCKQLQVLDIGNNGINDSFPSWLGSLKQLQVLILRSNKFHGPIHQPEDRDAFSKLHIIDLSSNGFTSNLSFKWFTNLKGMMDDGPEHQQILEFMFPELYQYYRERVTITLKGSEMEFLKVLTIFSSIDFSNNKFLGRIPKEIGNLKSLLVLNISHNDFSGPIPSSFGNLRQLESLDLSMNRLSGEIPVQLTALSFLSVLNLSHNRFVGRIPQAQQFLTFANDSFDGKAAHADSSKASASSEKATQVPPGGLVEWK
ncbi:receptor-like protein 12 [Cinnamomum micranthum f. kanehirae]|uniref:Receptor-like protein 12 n=1 Tax=Cinnamomum micranthum f. kanehirae TaxID=337451 RepID=A0A443NK72_9MAGN|nr:receptor-like protein 12 [Cinnamomum micranthum f. kanehirae]